MLNLETLKQHEYGKYITYHNPKQPRRWKRKKGVGVDLIIEILGLVFYIEMSYCSHSYPYRVNWFNKCRVPRFAKCKSDSKHYRIVLTNKSENFNPCRSQSKSNNIIVTTLSQLETRLHRLVRMARIIKHCSFNRLIAAYMVYACDVDSGISVTREQLESLRDHLGEFADRRKADL